MQRSKASMSSRQHAAVSSSSSSSMDLSPTTTAARKGIKLNDPSLRSCAAPKNIADNNSVTGAVVPHNTTVMMAQRESNNSRVSSSNNNGSDDGNALSSTMAANSSISTKMLLPPFKLVRTSSSSAVGDKENSNNSKVVLQQHCQGGNNVDPLLNNRDSGSMIDDERDDDVCDAEETVTMSDLESNEAMMMVSNETTHHQSNVVVKSSSSTTATPSSIGTMKLSYGDDHQHEEEFDNNNHLDNLNDDELQEDKSEMGGADEDNDNNNFYSDESEETIEAYKSEAPTNMTEEELSKYYWESCYGPGYVPPLTVQKSVPTKSCLSTKKKSTHPTENASSMTPRRILHKSPSFDKSYHNMMNEDDDDNNNNDKEEGYKDDTTPKNNVTQLVTSSTITRGQSAVKFGINSAAEFDLEMPTTEMKPMPPNVVQEFFPNDKVENQEKEEFCRETARNVSVLAEWDDDFDSYTQDGDDSDDDDNGETKLPKRRRKQTPYKQRRRRRGNNGLSRPRKCRRESSIFGSAERGRSLLEDCHEETDDDSSHHHGLPFSVTINPDEYTSPSSNSLNDSMSSLETAGAATMHQNGRQSVSSSSACISPSSLRSDSILNATGSRSSKETPKSARTSSSTILKTVHASGALLHTNSPQGGELMPNQLKYSPKGDGTITGTQHSSSPSSSGSLCSDIMSLFTKHSLEDETDVTLLSRQLSILSTHPTEGLQTSMSDLAQWIASSGKCPSQFINDHVSKGLDLSSSLSLLNDNGSSSSTASMFYGDSSLIDSALSEDNVLIMERCFELILGDTQYANNAAKTCKSRKPFIVDADAHTIASCLKILQELSSFSWSSSVELRCAEIILERFLTMSEDETVQALTLFDEKLSEATNITSVQLSTPRRLQKRKRKVSLQTAGAIESIKQLETKLLQESERLNDCKRAREVFTAHLDIERASPIAAISEEIRTSLFPAPVTHNGSDFTFSLLDGLAEIAMNVSLDDETLNHIEIGCFFKDVEGVALRLLQVYLLGCTELDFNCGHGPFPLRNSLLSIILPSCSSEAMPLGLKDLCADATHMFFKIDNLVRTVHRIECESGCNFECDDQDNAILSITLAHENAFLLRIEFVFRNLLHRSWNLTTVPDDVIVTSAQGLNDSTTTALISRLQQRARVILKAEYHNPSLLQIVCDEVMKIVAQCL